MVIVFALLAALANAVNEATQHIASIAAPRRSSGWRLVLYLFRNPLWLLGWVALAAAFVFQALALHNGLISVVQPLLATELVFMLVLRRFWIHQSIRLITWGAAALTCVLTQTAPATMKADIDTDKGGDGQQAQQAPVTDGQGADSDLPLGRAAPDRGGQDQDAFGRGRDERDGHGP